MNTRWTDDNDQSRQVIRVQEPAATSHVTSQADPKPDQAAPTTGSTTSGAARVALDRLAALVVGEPITHERMTIFPLLAPDSATSPLRYRTLEQALADGSVE